MLNTLGTVLIRAGEVTAQVDRAIRDVAARCGLRARSFTIPSGLFVRVGGDQRAAESSDDFAVAQGPAFRLDRFTPYTGACAGCGRRSCLPPKSSMSWAGSSVCCADTGQPPRSRDMCS